MEENANFVNKLQRSVWFDAKVDMKVYITKNDINNNC